MRIVSRMRTAPLAALIFVLLALASSARGDDQITLSSETPSTEPGSPVITTRTSDPDDDKGSLSVPGPEPCKAGYVWVKGKLHWRTQEVCDLINAGKLVNDESRDLERRKKDITDHPIYKNTVETTVEVARGVLTMEVVDEHGNVKLDDHSSDMFDTISHYVGAGGSSLMTAGSHAVNFTWNHMDTIYGAGQFLGSVSTSVAVNGWSLAQRLGGSHFAGFVGDMGLGFLRKLDLAFQRAREQHSFHEREERTAHASANPQHYASDDVRKAVDKFHSKNKEDDLLAVLDGWISAGEPVADDAWASWFSQFEAYVLDKGGVVKTADEWNGRLKQVRLTSDRPDEQPFFHVPDDLLAFIASIAPTADAEGHASRDGL